jgi:hypothetical protein
MSMFEDDRYRWRETYFVLFPTAQRPKLKKVEQALAQLDEHYELTNVRADDHEQFESLTLISPDDFAALDICYVEGDEVTEEIDELVRQIKPAELSAAGKKSLKLIPQCDARFDVLHFEQVTEEDEEDQEMLDPGALLLVLGALAKITGGIAVDPQSGTIFGEE